MKKKVLITYASKYGGTAEIARRIAGQFNNGSADLVVEPIENAGSPESYDMVILGVAIYMGQWRKQAVKYLKAHEDLLSEKDLWLFLSGPTGEGDPDEMLEGRKIPPKLKPLMERLSPEEVKTFHGTLVPEKMNGFEKWIIRKVKAPTGDFRIWSEIDQWGKDIAGKVQPGPVAS